MSLKENILAEALNRHIKNVFLFTLSTAEKDEQELLFIENETFLQLTLDNLEQVLVERLQLKEDDDLLIPANFFIVNPQAMPDTKIINYLFAAFCRNEEYINENGSVSTESAIKICDIIMKVLACAIKQPLENQNFCAQMLEIFKEKVENTKLKENFVVLLVTGLLKDDKAHLLAFITPIFTEIQEALKLSSLNNMEKWIMSTLMIFVNKKISTVVAETLLDFTTPETADGAKYSASLFGQLLSISFLPKNSAGPYEFFALKNLQEKDESVVWLKLWKTLKTLQDQIFIFFNALLLMGGSVEAKLLSWIKNAVDTNLFRGQLYSLYSTSSSTSSDAFMFGLAAVLLRLCKMLNNPAVKYVLVEFTQKSTLKETGETKEIMMTSVNGEHEIPANTTDNKENCQPTGTTVKEEEFHKEKIDDKENCDPAENVESVKKEEKKMLKVQNEKLKSDQLKRAVDKEEKNDLEKKNPSECVITDETYKFLTEIFVLTHKAVDLSYGVCMEKINLLYLDVVSLEYSYSAEKLANGGYLAGSITLQSYSSKAQMLHSLLKTIIEPCNDQLIHEFYETTAGWICHFLKKPENLYTKSTKSFTPQEMRPKSKVTQIQVPRPTLKETLTPQLF